MAAADGCRSCDHPSVVGKVKRCRRCKEIWLSSGFAVDRSDPTGLQAWCRRCKAEWERGPENVWKRLKSLLSKTEPSSLCHHPIVNGACSIACGGWHEQLYLSRWHEAGGNCKSCGAGLSEWQISGHRLDRIDNDTKHTPANCQMLCWVCNRVKSNRSWFALEDDVRPKIERWGRGRIPWQTYYPWAQRAELPDMSPHVANVQLVLGGGRW